MTTLLILHQGAIGDYLLTLPVIQAVREHLGGGPTGAIATAPSARITAGGSVVDRWLCPEKLGLYQLFCRELPVNDALATTLRDAKHVLSFLSGPGQAVDARLSELTAAQVVSIDPRPTAITRESRTHITQQWTADIRRAGWDIGDPLPARLHFSRPVASFLPRVLIHPGSGGQSKCWPIERWLQLVESLPAVDVTWMLGPAEVAQARELNHRHESILYEPDLEKAVEQMATYDLYIGNDGGMTHLAAALGLPTVAVFGTTDPQLWRPLGQHVRIVAPSVPQDDMTCITVDDVRPAVMDELSRIVGLIQ